MMLNTDGTDSAVHSPPLERPSEEHNDALSVSGSDANSPPPPSAEETEAVCGDKECEKECDVVTGPASLPESSAPSSPSTGQVAQDGEKWPTKPGSLLPQQQQLPFKVLLTKEQAVEIYAQRPADAAGANKSTDVAEKYGVSPKTIRDVWNRKTWVKVTRPLWCDDEVAAYLQDTTRRKPIASGERPGPAENGGEGGESVEAGESLAVRPRSSRESRAPCKRYGMDESPEPLPRRSAPKKQKTAKAAAAAAVAAAAAAAAAVGAGAGVGAVGEVPKPQAPPRKRNRVAGGGRKKQAAHQDFVLQGPGGFGVDEGGGAAMFGGEGMAVAMGMLGGAGFITAESEFDQGVGVAVAGEEEAAYVDDYTHTKSPDDECGIDDYPSQEARGGWEEDGSRLGLHCASWEMEADLLNCVA